MLACANGRHNMVEALVANGADIRLNSAYKMHAVAYAAAHNHYLSLQAIARGLTIKEPSHSFTEHLTYLITLADERGMSPLMRAVANKGFQTADFVLPYLRSEHLLWVCETINYNTVLHFAVEQGVVACIHAIIDAAEGLGVSTTLLTTQNGLGFSVLFQTVITQKLDIAHLLIDRYAPVWQLDRSGYTVLHHAVVSGNAALVNRLFDVMSMPGKQSRLHEVLLMATLMSDKVAILADYFYRRRFSIQGRINGEPFLHIAVRNKSSRMIGWLIQVGVDPTLTNDEDKNAYDVAQEHGFEDMLPMLIPITMKRLSLFSTPPSDKYSGDFTPT